MINKINKEMRRSMNATLHGTATRNSGKEPRRTKTKTGRVARQSTDMIIT
jgi:hypothetical protein